MSCSAALAAALASALDQLDAISSGDEERFLERVDSHTALCTALVGTTLATDDKPALEALMALNRRIVESLNEAQETLRGQMSQGRANMRLARAYIR